MSVLAVCPYCHEGRVRAPDHAVGLSATCRRCGSCFTIVPSPEPAPEPARPPVPVARPAAEPTRPAIPVGRPAVPVGRPAVPVARPAVPPVPAAPAPDPAPPTATMAAGDTSTLTPAAPEPILPPDPAPAADVPGPPTDPALPLALVAFTLAGLGLVLSQVPYGRVATVVLTGLGLLLGLAGLLFAERRRAVPGLAAGLSAAGLLVVIALPGWLGLESWRPAPAPDPFRTPVAVPHGRGAPGPADWVDVSQASWRLQDVRVAVRSAGAGPVELLGPKGQKKWTRERYLQVWLEVTNVGVARKVEFRAWEATAPPGGDAPRLTDPAGKVLAAKTFDPGTTPAWRAQTAGLLPGKSADQLLVFEAPPAAGDFLRLELPGGAFGAAETVRLQIPRSFLSSRSSP